MTVIDPSAKQWGVDYISQERSRQIREEGYERRDDVGTEDDLMCAALCYVASAVDTSRQLDVHVSPNEIASNHRDCMPEAWPWSQTDWKPSGDVRRDLIRAGALIAAALDAIDGAS